MQWCVGGVFTGEQVGDICHPSDSGLGATGMASEGRSDGGMVGKRCVLPSASDQSLENE